MDTFFELTQKDELFLYLIELQINFRVSSFVVGRNSCWPARGPAGCRASSADSLTSMSLSMSLLLLRRYGVGLPGGRPAIGPPARTHFNVVVTSQYRISQCSFCFGATGPPRRLHLFANKVGSPQVVLGWNRQTRSDYLFVVSRLMKIWLMMTRRGTGPGGAR